MLRMRDADCVITRRNIEESEHAVGAGDRFACATDRHWASRWGALTQFNLRAGNGAIVLIADDALD